MPQLSSQQDKKLQPLGKKKSSGTKRVNKYSNKYTSRISSTYQKLLNKSQIVDKENRQRLLPNQMSEKEMRDLNIKTFENGDAAQKMKENIFNTTTTIIDGCESFSRCGKPLTSNSNKDGTSKSRLKQFSVNADSRLHSLV